MEGHYGGGHKQRLESKRACYPGLDRHSPLATFLLTTYMRGQLTLPTRQCIAPLAFDQPSKHPNLERLAGLGGYGANTSHTSRDLFRKLAANPLEAALGEFPMPLKSNGVVGWVQQSMLGPHAVFATMYHSYPDKFAKRMYGCAKESIGEFWRSQVDRPSFANHPMHYHEFPFRE